MQVETKKHILHIDNRKSIIISGVVTVIELCDKNVSLKLADSVISIKGEKLSASKLNVDEGTIQIECESISSINYSKSAVKEKFSVSQLFK